jgi:hypothetical protein
MRLDFLSLNLYICKRMSLTGHKQKHKHTHTLLCLYSLSRSSCCCCCSLSLSFFQFQYQFQFQCVLIFDLSMSATRGFFYWSLTFLLPFYFILLLLFITSPARTTKLPNTFNFSLFFIQIIIAILEFRIFF